LERDSSQEKGPGQACINLQFDGEKVRAATREAAAGRQGSVSAAEFVEFDFERPQTFAPALDGSGRTRPGRGRPSGTVRGGKRKRNYPCRPMSILFSHHFLIQTSPFSAPFN